MIGEYDVYKLALQLISLEQGATSADTEEGLITLNAYIRGVTDLVKELDNLADQRREETFQYSDWLKKVSGDGETVTITVGDSNENI